MTFLSEAEQIVIQRQDRYGHPLKDFANTAKFWSIILGIEITPAQVALCLLAVKMSRELHQSNRDNRLDMAGYAAALDLVTLDGG